jgi:hypothetical protein
LMETKFTTFISTPMGMEQEPLSGSPT